MQFPGFGNAIFFQLFIPDEDYLPTQPRSGGWKKCIAPRETYLYTLTSPPVRT